jgi:two-component system sensor histidine kinase/response regulator
MAGEIILVVEDDSALLQGLRDILELSGYRVRTGRNGVEGLADLEKQLPDVIVSDINMPQMDGYQFYAQVRANPDWVSLPFIFLSAKSEKDDIRRGKLLGADDYIIKPFEEADLLVAIQAKLNRRAELQAAMGRQMDDLKRTILTTLNHEFRTPLTYITTYSDMLREADLSSDEFKEFMHGIQLGSERLRRLVEDFILLVELQTGEANQSFEMRRERLTDLTLVVSLVLEKLRPKAEARRVSLVEDIAGPLPTILADRAFLVDALSRLVDNAIKFSGKDGGVVTVKARPGGRGLLMQVSDRGIGIPPSERDKIFDLFYQIDRPKMEQQGSGSGLAIARGIIRLHGGELTCESTGSQGSTFTIDLPIRRTGALSP